MGAFMSQMKTYNIKYKVQMQPYKGNGLLDLTSAVESISISKDLYSASGRWTIVLKPMKDQAGFSWYYKISPMDYFDIRFARFPKNWTGKELPPIMRGFVDSVNLKVTVDGEGRPNRQYIISGRDYGKLLEITLAWWGILDPAMAEVPDVPFLMAKYNFGMYNTPVAFFNDCFNRLLTPQMQAIQKIYSKAPALTPLLSKDVGQTLAPTSTLSHDGSVWSLVSMFSNAPWNEAYVTEQKDGPAFVFRKTPWKDEKGTLLQQPEALWNTLGGISQPVKIVPDDIISIDLIRSDSEAVNYCFTYPTGFLLGDTYFKAAAAELNQQIGKDIGLNPYIIDPDDEDAGMHRFGFRKMENQTEYFQDWVTMGVSQGSVESVIATDMAQLNQVFIEANRKNSCYEKGQVVLKGNEDIKPGVFFTFDTPKSQQVQPEYYVTAMQHDLSVRAGAERFQTVCTLVRGTGFLKTRNLMNSMNVERQRLKPSTNG